MPVSAFFAHNAPSVVSLTPSFEFSLRSLYTTTSSRTNWGPGALAGKAILALGKAALRGAERVIISRRLDTIRAHLPCADAKYLADDRFMDDLFADLLELSRPELYPRNIRDGAMELVLLQVASLQTTAIISSLSSWPLDDLALLIMEIMSISMFCHSGLLEPRLASAYISSLPEHHHHLLPGIIFISSLIQRHEIAFEAAILSKFLEFLLLAATDPQLRQHGHVADTEYQPGLDAAFSTLCAPPPGAEELWRSTLSQFWPQNRTPSLKELIQHMENALPERWLALNVYFLQREAPKMLELATPRYTPSIISRRNRDNLNYLYTLKSSAVSAPLEFRKTEPLTARAISLFTRCVILGGDVSGITAHYLRLRSHRTKVLLFARTVSFYLEKTQNSRPEPLGDRYPPVDDDQRFQSLLKFLLDLSEQDKACRCAIMDAALAILVPFLGKEWDPAAIHDDLYARSNLFPFIKRGMSYSKRTNRLLRWIQENGVTDTITWRDGKINVHVREILELIFKSLGVVALS